MFTTCSRPTQETASCGVHSVAHPDASQYEPVTKPSQCTRFRHHLENGPPPDDFLPVARSYSSTTDTPTDSIPTSPPTPKQNPARQKSPNLSSPQTSTQQQLTTSSPQLAPNKARFCIHCKSLHTNNLTHCWTNRPPQIRPKRPFSYPHLGPQSPKITASNSSSIITTNPNPLLRKNICTSPRHQTDPHHLRNRKNPHARKNTFSKLSPSPYTTTTYEKFSPNCRSPTLRCPPCHPRTDDVTP